MRGLLAFGATVALALLATGCGGGGGSPGGGGPPPIQALGQETLVVQMDQNGDSELDLITLDISESPFVILECLYGMPGGDFDDVTDVVKGRPIDPAVSGALATDPRSASAVTLNSASCTVSGSRVMSWVMTAPAPTVMPVTVLGA